MNPKLKEKLLESLMAVLPITLIVLALSVALVPMDVGTAVMFTVGAVLLVFGMGLFQLGAEMAMTPLGEGIGVQMERVKKIPLIVAIAFVMGVIITIAEPDLQVLAQQVPSIPNRVLIYSVAVGVGAFLALAVVRILKRISLSKLLVVLYGLLAAVSIFVPESFLAVAYDSGGVTTGPMTVPFIMALGIGFSAIRSDKHAENDSFGLVALCSVGPILAVLILGLIFRTSDSSYTAAVIPKIQNSRDLMNLPVLVVDDDRTCCESTVATLKEIGIMGEWVLSGREAVERCYARHELKDDYFAVILDWKMPDMDGIETARQIRKRIGKEITIIVLTSYEFSEIEEEAKAAGVDAFIAKPLFRSRLTATLRQFTSGRKEKTARNYLEKLSESDYTGKRILLVEDNELNREIAGEILQMTGAEVETAENGKIAVEKVEASPEGLYDLVFMDIQMPVMNGYEATAAIRSLPGEQGKLPIVAMTANAFAEDVQLAKNTGMNGHIAKPLDMNKLNAVLESWL